MENHTPNRPKVKKYIKISGKAEIVKAMNTISKGAYTVIDTMLKSEITFILT
jgi:hypothetical protein